MPPKHPPEADEIHISVSFTWDMPQAEALAVAWSPYAARVEIGGPGAGQRGEQFVCGRYLAEGYVITSRGCPNHCWFCDVWRREGKVRELPVVDGWNVLDDNLLACSEDHIRQVFEMLRAQKAAGREIQFTGGLEAARLRPWQVRELRALRPRQLFFAYDTPDDLQPLMEAGRMLQEAGFTRASHRLRCFVLVGYPKDTFDLAETRLRQAYAAGFLPMAMLWRDKHGERDMSWMRFQKLWARPAITSRLLRET